MDYQRIYNQIIERAQQRGKIAEYTESHHIVPKCLGGSNKKKNLVNLTAREHLLAHWLLHKIYPTNHKLAFAFHMMTVDKTGQRYYNSRAYAIAREAMKSAMSKVHKGRKQNEEHKEKNRIAKLGNTSKLGKKESEHACRKKSQTRMGWKDSDITKQRKSESAKRYWAEKKGMIFVSAEA